jgi:hypothetical protein
MLVCSRVAQLSKVFTVNMFTCCSNKKRNHALNLRFNIPPPSYSPIKHLILNLQISDEKMTERVNRLKEEVSRLFGACKNVMEKLNLVDTLQHLGIDHLFEEPIATTLSSIHNAEFNSSSLHQVALRFRLLRQHGFWVSAGTIIISYIYIYIYI